MKTNYRKKRLSVLCSKNFQLSTNADTSLNHLVPLAGHGIMTLLVATFSMMASPGSAKDGAAVRTGIKTHWVKVQEQFRQ